MSLRRISVVLSVIAVVGLLWAAPADAKKVKEWVVTRLPELSGWQGTIGNDVSDSGYIGGLFFDADGGHAAAWYKGEAYDLEDEIGMPEGMEESGVYSVNSSGQMGGNAWVARTGAQVGVIWDVKKGTMVTLKPSKGYIACALYGLNASGSATGFAVEDLTYAYVPWVWPKGDTTGKALPLGDADHGVPWGMNSSGDIGGATYDAFFNPYAAMWLKNKKGEYELYDLHSELQDEDEDIAWSIVLDIGEDGTVVGQAVTEEIDVRPFTWSLAKGLTLLDKDEEGRAIAWKKKSNTVAGGIGGTPALTDDACVWVKGVLDVIPDLSDCEVMESSSVNGSGLVVGYAFTKEGAYQGWTAEKK